MNPSEQPVSNPRIFSRTNFLQVLAAAMDSGAYRFARQAALNWLAVFPGDLTVQLILGKTHLAEGKLAQALPVVERVSRYDPEYLDAVETLCQIYGKIQSEKLADAQCAAVILGSTIVDPQGLAEWCGWHRSARQAMLAGKWKDAENFLHQVLSVAPDFALAAVDHLNIGWQHQERSTLHQLANLYHTHWPDCLQFALRLAEVEIEFGNESTAVSLVHQCVANDAVGQTALRLWGKDHRYQPLWPGGLEIFLDLPIPVDVAFQLGWNRLPAGELIVPPTIENLPAQELASPAQDLSQIATNEPPRASSPVSETSQMPDPSLKAVEDTFARLAKQMKRPSLGRSDGRYPVYVIFSTAKGLDAQYGPQTREILAKEMQQLSEYVSRRPGWNSLVFFPDLKECTDKLGLAVVDSLDPWKLKLSLSDLDGALAKKGQMIGALLIVGGPEIVPFHRLPNPTDDVDQDVPSDNPYATLDSNYFVPEWPVGRLPGESGKDAGLLLEHIRNLNQYHAKKAKTLPQLADLLRWLIDFLNQLAAGRKLKGFGYTAAVWKESSALVLQAMGETGDLVVSPPQTSQSVGTDRLLNSPLEYFNLHGLPDAAEWYGQKDSSTPTNEPDYPVALSPKNLVRNGNAPQIVFTEACYGAHILEKAEDQSLALKFLSIGSKAVIGSTTISYGSVAAPLIGADLLGYHLWKYLREGSTVGEALLQAKLALAKEMNQRQGFLDGEDQKTLISFVLYGDPLTGYDAFKTRAKSTLRFKSHPLVKTMSDHPADQVEGLQISQAVLKEVKAIVEVYLPGLDSAEFRISQLHDMVSSKDQDSLSEDTGKKSRKGKQFGTVVVTVSKSVKVAKRTFHQYARVTLNDKGKMIKLAISR